ncbi:MAG: hypothetical protein AABY14_02355 [Nanoarchaeota archaeon]
MKKRVVVIGLIGVLAIISTFLILAQEQSGGYLVILPPPNAEDVKPPEVTPPNSFIIEQDIGSVKLKKNFEPVILDNGGEIYYGIYTNNLIVYVQVYDKPITEEFFKNEVLNKFLTEGKIMIYNTEERIYCAQKLDSYSCAWHSDNKIVIINMGRGYNEKTYSIYEDFKDKYLRMYPSTVDIKKKGGEPKPNIELTISTTKDEYVIGERVELS